MRKLHQQAIDLLGSQAISDRFTEQERQFEETLFELSQKSIDGTASSSEEAKKITSWFERSIWSGVIGLTATTSKPITFDVSGASFLASAAIGEDAEGLQEWIQQRVRNHPATKDRSDLKDLMLEPVSKLTQAFANSMMQIAQTRGRSLVLVLDTYEKAQSYLDRWLWQSLVEDTSLSSGSVRLVVVGRRSLQSDENWRKLHQDRKLLHETHLTKFSKKDTEEYLKQIGIEHGGTQAKIYKATKGLPYYLNWVRDRKEKGLEPDFFQGNQAIAELLLQGLDTPQQKVLQVVACCRWFDRSMIRHLIESDVFGLQQDANNAEIYFEWLKQSDFVEHTKGRYCLDDVARDVFRQSYFQDDRTKFRKTNALLADYFKQQADELFDVQCLLPESYEDEDWRGAIIEFLYYGLFGKGKEGLIQYIEHVFAAVYLRYPDVFSIPFAFIQAEMNDENKDLLHNATTKFFNDSSMGIIFASHALHVYPINYEFNSEDKKPFSERRNEEISRQIEISIQHLLGHIGDLRHGLGKCVGLIYKSLRDNESIEKIDTLKESKKQLDKLRDRCPNRIIISIASNICNLLMDEKSYKDSLNCYQIMVELDRENTTIFIGQGFAFLNLKRYEEALESFQKAIEIDPTSVEALTNLGVTFLNLNQDEKAIINLQKATDLDSNFINAWLSLGNALINLERYEEALVKSQKAIEINPKSVNAWNIQGSALFGLEEYEKALESYQQAINLDPNSVDALTNRGATLINLNQQDEALETSQQAISLVPEYVNAWINRGTALLNLGQHDESLESYQKAINVDSESIDAWVNRATALIRLGRHEEALEHCQKAIEIRPKSIKDWINIGIALVKLSRYEEALESYGQAIKLSPKSLDAFNRQGYTLLGIERYEEALKSYQKVVDINPKSSNAWINKGLVLSRLERYEDALKSYHKATELDPKSVKAWINQGYALYELERYEEQLKSSQMAIDLDPESIDAWIERGVALSELEQYEKALESHQKAIDIDPQCASAWNRRGVVLLALGRYQESLVACDRAFEIDGINFDTLNTQSLTLSLLKKFEEAITAIDRLD
ncbi:tetratricopeptide repeat protein [Chamaesiphon polymorphus]|uniref:Uncharacterized protein n=1 Tax=Chamaesiphon polymorphus CCALA 037 TaxID=2107692 RepID=A0A2T1GHL2_9CYAN|nr:tetratricopeptide repeat protein [Chamaesiphon polymorphus]PSB57194.1 hypothetical protein C7B77_09275 [Chamaesiphon polymorphus CCALA 037]